MDPRNQQILKHTLKILENLPEGNEDTSSPHTIIAFECAQIIKAVTGLPVGGTE